MFLRAVRELFFLTCTCFMTTASEKGKVTAAMAAARMVRTTDMMSPVASLRSVKSSPPNTVPALTLTMSSYK